MPEPLRSNKTLTTLGEAANQSPERLLHESEKESSVLVSQNSADQKLN